MCLESKQFESMEEAHKFCVENKPDIAAPGFLKSFRWKAFKSVCYMPKVRFNDENMYSENYITWHARTHEHYFFCFGNKGHVSVMRHCYSHGGNKGLFEMMFLKPGNFYDPIGYLTDKQVNKILKKISKLDKVGIKEWEKIKEGENKFIKKLNLIKRRLKRLKKNKLRTQ